MTDEMLVREWWGNLSPDEIGNVQMLTALLASVRLDEAKWWHKNMPKVYEKVTWCTLRISTLEAAAKEGE